MTSKNKYIDEDKDIVIELKNISNFISHDTNNENLQKLQIEALLRNRKSLEDFNKNTSRSNDVLLALTMILFVVAVVQLITTIVLNESNWNGTIISIIVAIIIFGFSRMILKDITKT